MGNDDKVLSQSEIDALLSSSAVSVPARAAAPPPVKAKAAVPPAAPKAAAPAPASPEPKVASATPPSITYKAKTAPEFAPAPQQVVREGPSPEQVTNLCKKIVSDETSDLVKQIIELTIKVKKLDDVKQRMEKVEDKLDKIAEMVQSSPKAVLALGARMDELYTLLAGMKQGRQQGDEERIHDQFHCVKCHSEKLVAIHVKCTTCGMENWMGWFPEAKHESLPEHY